MSDSDDRHRADLFEIELRRKADLDPGNCWELIWFLQLPLEVRSSYMRILEARIDQAATRKYLARQSCYYQRDWRAPTHSCLVIEAINGSARPWGSIGRRQRRTPVKPRPPVTRREREPPKPTKVKPSPKHPSTAKQPAYTAPARPATPDRLREALSANSNLMRDAIGHAPNTLTRCHSPEPEPVPDPIVEKMPEEAAKSEPFPEPYPTNGPLSVKDSLVEEDLSYLVAVGHYLRAPEEGYTVQQAAGDLHVLQFCFRDFYHHLTGAFSVNGEHSSRVIATFPRFTTIVSDLVRGWSTVPKSWKDGSEILPDPRSRCMRCGCVQ